MPKTLSPQIFKPCSQNGDSDIPGTHSHLNDCQKKLPHQFISLDFETLKAETDLAEISLKNVPEFKLRYHGGAEY